MPKDKDNELHQQRLKNFFLFGIYQADDEIEEVPTSAIVISIIIAIIFVGLVFLFI